MKFVKYAVVASLFSVLFGCAQSPTGRSQLVMFSSAQMNQMGADAFVEMKIKQRLSANEAHVKRVQCVANAIIPHVDKRVYAGDWEVQVFEDKQVNAFALPGGKIGVYTGLLKVAKTPEQLAAVIGHEVGHVIANHSNERMTNNTLTQIGMSMTDVALSESPYKNELMSALGLGVQVGVTLPYSRSHESEADIIGLELMAKAGFEPQASVALWQNMEKSAGERPPEILSTHPAPQSRIKNLQAKMQKATNLYLQTKPTRCP